MKASILIGLMATAALAAEVNPPHPAAVPLLGDPATCLRFARECGEHLLEVSTGKPEVYSGDAGVALFLFNLYAATKDKRFLTAADRLLAGVPELESTGLYVGAAGTGEVCLAAWRATADDKYLERARACAARIAKAPPFAVTDIISGAAGTGIFLLNLHAATGEEGHLAAARKTGDFLAATAVREGGKASWPVSPGRNPRTYVGLSHGAAGVGYFLLHLHRATGEKRYRTLAEEAARFVIDVAQADGTDGWKWTKIHPPLKPDAFPVQWCHGSPGNGLFFCDLEHFLGGDAYRAALDRCIASTRREGRTARVGGCQCHGVSGNAELFVEAYRLRREKALMDDARLFASALLQPHDNGFRFATRIGNYRYPPGYMLGLAGIGQFFLRLAAPESTPLPFMVQPTAARGE